MTSRYWLLSSRNIPPICSPISLPATASFVSFFFERYQHHTIPRQQRRQQILATCFTISPTTPQQAVSYYPSITTFTLYLGCLQLYFLFYSYNPFFFLRPHSFCACLNAFFGTLLLISLSHRYVPLDITYSHIAASSNTHPKSPQSKPIPICYL